MAQPSAEMLRHFEEKKEQLCKERKALEQQAAYLQEWEQRIEKQIQEAIAIGTQQAAEAIIKLQYDNLEKQKVELQQRLQQLEAREKKQPVAILAATPGTLTVKSYKKTGPDITAHLVADPQYPVPTIPESTQKFLKECPAPTPAPLFYAQQSIQFDQVENGTSVTSKFVFFKAQDLMSPVFSAEKNLEKTAAPDDSEMLSTVANLNNLPAPPNHHPQQNDDLEARFLALRHPGLP